MEAREQSLRFLTLVGKIIIPFFQRTYVWEKENWEELFDELSKDNNTKNFLGTIILKQLPINIGEPTKLEVIDGQQRLTTISILLKALLDNLPQEQRNMVENDIKQILFFTADLWGQRRIKIEHSAVDKDAYEQVINGPINTQNINDQSHKIHLCYRFFHDKINEKIDQETRNELIRKMINKLLDPNNRILVVIDLSVNDDEQKIFDTLNTAGVRLTSAEIIKNALFKKFIELENRDDAINYYRETWERTFLSDQETTKYWEAERQTGRLRRDNIEILLHSIAVIKGFYDPDEHVLSDLSKLYKQKIQNFINIQELKDFINEIISYAELYREKIIAFERDTSLSYDDDLIRLLHILDTLEISTFHPFILYVLKEYQNDEQREKELLFNLEKFIVRNLLLNKFPTKNYNKLCKQFISDLAELNDKLNNLPIEDCIGGLKNINNKNASLLLFWIELYRRHNNNYYDIRELDYNYSLEHIMPQNWQGYWNFDRVPHPNPNLADEEKTRDRNEKIYWLGNMTLLRNRLNSLVGNHDFATKMNGNNGRRGIKAYADLSITRDIVLPFDNGDRVWNETKIEERTNQLFQEIENIWGD